MRGLMPEERAVLVHLAAPVDGAVWLADDDERGVEIRERLTAQGRLRSGELPGLEEGCTTVWWEITDLGRLALKVCT